MPWTSCKSCKGEGQISDPKQPTWEAIKIGPKYIKCPNRDCLNGKIYVNKYKSESHKNQYMPSEDEIAAQNA
jgi:hypothetical protein